MGDGATKKERLVLRGATAAAAAAAGLRLMRSSCGSSSPCHIPEPLPPPKYNKQTSKTDKQKDPEKKAALNSQSKICFTSGCVSTRSIWDFPLYFLRVFMRNVNMVLFNKTNCSAFYVVWTLHRLGLYLKRTTTLKWIWHPFISSFKDSPCA